MKKCVIFFASQLTVLLSYSQTVASITAEMEASNATVVSRSCSSQYGLIITDRALNVLLANKIASYLSEGGNISLYKNYATLNTSDGRLSLNSNVHVGYGTDERIKSLTTVGVKANVADGFAAVFSDKKFENDLGLTFRRTWFFRGSTFFDGCEQRQVRGHLPPVASAQKRRMNAERALLINRLHGDMTNEATSFETAVTAMTAADVPDDDLGTVQGTLRAKFYRDLRDTYLKKFAEGQAEALEQTQSYNLITASWISIGGYLPVTTQKFSVAKTIIDNFQDEEVYPWEINLSFNRIWESRTKGRFFLFLSGGAFMNTSVSTGEVDKLTLREYKERGGPDPIQLAELSSNDAYVGSYSSFPTPLLRGQFVWFPRKWNVGISLLMEQNFGPYNPMNGRLGIPIRLNDQDGEATVNFEIQLRASDMTGQIQPEKSFGKKASVGVSVGLPFSSFIY